MLFSRQPEFGSRRAELADLLRVRRHALKSSAVGLPLGRQRRTPGLRREEVAELAGVSCSMYVALEQGRDIPVSAAAIDAIARALQLTESERLHALRLIARTTMELRESVTPRLRRFIAANPTPMYVLDHAWDIIVVNAAAAALFGLEYPPNEAQPENALIRAYLSPDCRTLFGDSWRTMVRSSTEAFRLETAQSPADGRAVRLVERLLAESIEFAEDWKEHGVREHPRDTYRLEHAMCGTLTMEPSAYGVLESPNLRIMAFTLSDDASIEKIGRLARTFALAVS